MGTKRNVGQLARMLSVMATRMTAPVTRTADASGYDKKRGLSFSVVQAASLHKKLSHPTGHIIDRAVARKAGHPSLTRGLRWE